MYQKKTMLNILKVLLFFFFLLGGRIVFSAKENQNLILNIKNIGYTIDKTPIQLYEFEY
jgi:hypothetical protein